MRLQTATKWIVWLDAQRILNYNSGELHECIDVVMRLCLSLSKLTIHINLMIISVILKHRFVATL